MSDSIEQFKQKMHYIKTIIKHIISVNDEWYRK